MRVVRHRSDNCGEVKQVNFYALPQTGRRGNICVHINIILTPGTKTIAFDNPFQTLREPINHLPDKNGWLYALQLNTYKYMLESEAGFRVASMYLGQVHPSLARGRLIEVPPMAEEMSLIVEDQIELGHAVCRAVTGADAQFGLPRKERASLR